MTFVWLASYPKSGNTWLRILLSNYLTDTGIGWEWDSRLLGPPSHLERHAFDEAMGISSADIPVASLDFFRRQLHDQFVTRFLGTSFSKTHEAFYSANDGLPMFPSNAASKAVYLVRNPLDVAASYAHHKNHTCDALIEHLANPDAKVRYGDTFFDEHTGSWSEHVAGWTQQGRVETLTVRFEDLLREPAVKFTEIVDFCGLEVDQEKIERAVAASSFERLQAREIEAGFRALADTSRRFFRKGESGGWRKELTAGQASRIISDHGEIMTRLAYRGADGV